MNFLAPLGFAFAAAIPVVVVFYLLKRKRVVKLVSSTLLWQKFLAETQASAPFQKLRKNWLLILQIILLTVAVLALSRPFFKTKAKPAELRVVILDASASMQAIDESPSRFEKARSEALKWVDSLADTDQMVILQAGANTEVELSLDDRLLETRPLKIPAGEASPQVFKASQARDGIFSLRLTSKDDLAADNQASIVSLLPKPVKILLVSRGNRLLEKAFRAVANVELATATDLTDPATVFDFVVLDDVTPTVWPAGNVLAIHVV